MLGLEGSFTGVSEVRNYNIVYTSDKYIQLRINTYNLNKYNKALIIIFSMNLTRHWIPVFKLKWPKIIKLIPMLSR